MNLRVLRGFDRLCRQAGKCVKQGNRCINTHSDKHTHLKNTDNLPSHTSLDEHIQTHLQLHLSQDLSHPCSF